MRQQARSQDYGGCRSPNPGPRVSKRLYLTDVHFFSSENLGEFRIRGFVVGLYLRNISNENLGTSSMFALRGRFEAVKANTHETDG
jgi:hypothetical protein